MRRMPSGGTRDLPGGTRVKVRRLVLRVEAGPDKGASAQLDRGTLVVGTADDCDLVLRDDTVSAHHCELLERAGVLVLRDLRSTNGVRVNGCRVMEACPEVGAKIELGATRLSLRAGADDERWVSGEARFGPLMGNSQVMRALFSDLADVSGSPAPALIEGETGTGKSLAAEAIHAASPRAGGPLVVFDCGAVAPQLVESELFGHERGAFTGAAGARAGLAAEADGGTLVLDEIGELPLDLQPKLLRLVERKEIRPVGSNQAKAVDARIVACTHRSLRAEIKAGRFREDLYYRLSALSVRMPSLRERLDDLPALVDDLLSASSSLRFDALPESDRELLLSHRWPGNLRELRNAVDRLMAFSSSRRPLVEVEPGAEARPPPPAADGASAELPSLAVARERAHESFERRYLEDAMSRAKGSISEAARLAGVPRQFVQRLLRKHGMR